MPVYKDSERNTWYVKGRYRDWKGEARWCTRRGFKTKREAQKWETDFKAKSHNDLSMTMADFSAIYLEEMEPRLKQSSLIAKKSILTRWILPYFGRRRVNEITGSEIIRWQNMLLSHCDERTGRPFSKNYLRNLNAQLTVLFRYAAKYYGLHDNPMDGIMGIGSSREGKCDFWTLEEFNAFSDACMEEPMAYYCFQMLYWTGIREGELLALTEEDFDFENGTVSVSKTYHCFHGKDVVTTPKTKKSVRVVGLTERLTCEMQGYLRLCYDRRAGDRMFPVQPYFLQSRIKKYAAEAGVKTIRIHDLRHSHVSLLINMGLSALEIGDRIGHESQNITYHYAHLFPSSQKNITDKLNALSQRGGSV